MFDENKVRTDFDIKPTSVLDSIKVVDMYNLVRHNGCNHFSRLANPIFIDTQFSNEEFRREELNNRNNE